MSLPPRPPNCTYQGWDIFLVLGGRGECTCQRPGCRAMEAKNLTDAYRKIRIANGIDRPSPNPFAGHVLPGESDYRLGRDLFRKRQVSEQLRAEEEAPNEFNRERGDE